MERRRPPSSTWGEGQVRSGTFQEESSVVRCREVDWGKIIYSIQRPRVLEEGRDGHYMSVLLTL